MNKEIKVNMDCGEFRINQMELQVIKLKQRVREIELENEIMMLEDELDTKSSSGNKVIDFFDWYIETYPELEFNDIELKDIKNFNAINNK